MLCGTSGLLYITFRVHFCFWSFGLCLKNAVFPCCSRVHPKDFDFSLLNAVNCQHTHSPQQRAVDRLLLRRRHQLAVSQRNQLSLFGQDLFWTPYASLTAVTPPDIVVCRCLNHLTIYVSGRELGSQNLLNILYGILFLQYELFCLGSSGQAADHLFKVKKCEKCCIQGWRDGSAVTSTDCSWQGVPTTICDSGFRGPDALSWPLQTPHACGVH